jgi:predicted metal-dependent phosphotriesterase family hydrolase
MTAIPTARGDTVDSSELGFTCITERVFRPTQEINPNWPDLSFGEGDDVDRRISDAIDGMKTAKEAGVSTIVDRTLPGNGRFGWVDQMMISNGDSCFDDLFPQKMKAKDRRFPPYTELIRDSIPTLLEVGVDQLDIDKMTVSNPRRFFETTARGAY